MLIAGVDEVGRGPWAGPVVSAAVVFKKETLIPDGICDSKSISAKKREDLYDKILEVSYVGIGQSDARKIDEINILQATLLSMKNAIDNLPIKPDYVLVDGNQMPKISIAGEAVIKGDSKKKEIGAASIIAKVTRDRLMADLSMQFPGYGWEKNMGYGTKEHSQALITKGVTPYHRRSFAPIRKLLAAESL